MGEPRAPSGPDLAGFAVAAAAAECAASDVCAASSALTETAQALRRKSGSLPATRPREVPRRECDPGDEKQRAAVAGAGAAGGQR